MMAGSVHTSAALRPRKEGSPTSINGGQPHLVLMSQGEVRPGVVQGQHWRFLTWWEKCPTDRLPYTRTTPKRRPNLRLSNRMQR